MIAWTSVADIRARVRRRWEDGSILRSLALGAPFPVIEVALRGPKPAEIGDDLDAVRAWMAELELGSRDGARYTLRYAPVGGRLIGRNELPRRAVVESCEQAVALLGVADQRRAYEAALSVVSDEPDVRAWVAANPLPALEVIESWPELLSAYRWLRDSRGSLHYLREITAPGVDTKFVERHRAVLAKLLGVPASASGFLDTLGLRAKPETMRLRVDATLPVFAGLSDVTARVAELAVLDLTVKSALIVENEITFLSVPIPAGGVVLWGKGFEVVRAGSMPWLVAADVVYWGDLDTHGFAILNQLRAWLPQSRSLLMDRETMLAHRHRWVTEGAPTSARLDRLTEDEQALYRDLVSDRFGQRVRLEQERIDWTWAVERLAGGDKLRESGRQMKSGTFGNT
jgi:hypothetical protein